MRFPSFSHPVTGTAVPVSALRTTESCGVGEFADLVPFAEWCKETGLDLIQLLPVNDTGTESSPYSALSAFALHPIYIRLQDLPEGSAFTGEIHAIRSRFEALSRFDYRGIREAKLSLLWKMYRASQDAIANDPSLEAWIAINSWIVEYAVFMNIKRKNFDASWKEWEKFRTPSHSEIQKRWESASNRADHLFFAWVQMRLDEQFKRASERCDELGIALKGDIPIMMNEDSCDAWANPEFFRDDLRAGSPPDGSNPLGQNWGFPIYDWENLEEDGYGWWKRRLEHSARYYHAYRIDHILGFFRIWSIPAGESTGYLGWTTPHAPITAQELAELGFSGDRLRWICEPHVPTRIVEAVNGYDYLGAHGTLAKVMDRIGSEELWLFKDTIKCERDIWNADISESVKGALAAAWRDRLLQVTGRDGKGKVLFAPIWSKHESTAWKSLSDAERGALERLFADKDAQNGTLWKDQAVRLLATLTGSVDMLACAEDLGSVPDIVPDVLARLGILGLKVFRWERIWNREGQPYRDIASYPVRSVATTSVHDSSTLRGWWEREHGGNDFFGIRNPSADGIPADKSESWHSFYGGETAAWALSAIAETASSLLVVPLQDLMALDDAYRNEDPDADRINVPGSVSAFNWTWRIPVTVESLDKNRKLVSAIQKTFAARRGKHRGDLQ